MLFELDRFTRIRTAHLLPRNAAHWALVAVIFRIPFAGLLRRLVLCHLHDGPFTDYDHIARGQGNNGTNVRVSQSKDKGSGGLNKVSRVSL